ncbi:MAG TPA: SAM domain-containing protein [Roseiarcus sp.]
MDVATWLRGLGLERHETAFRDNLIDLDVIRELTESDLEKLALALGDHKRVLKAVAASLSMLEPAATAPTAAPRARGKGERWPVKGLDSRGARGDAPCSEVYGDRAHAL